MNNLRAGDLLHISREASVQFTRPIRFRLIRVLDWPAFDGWAWIDGYQLNRNGDAVARRQLLVQPAGLRRLPAGNTPPPRGGSGTRRSSTTSGR